MLPEEGGSQNIDEKADDLIIHFPDTLKITFF